MTEANWTVDETQMDPADWEPVRQLGRKMVDDLVDYLSGIRDQPAWQPVPDTAKAYLSRPLPREGRPAETVYEEFLQHIRPFPMGNIHPRFWGWVMGTGSITGAFAEMLAAGMNSNVCLGEQSAMYVEKQVIGWCRELMGFPNTASGILVSGATMANLTALQVARHVKIFDGSRGMGLMDIKKLPVLYCSTETHNCIAKAMSILGFPAGSVRKIEVDQNFRIKMEQLRLVIEQDLRDGHQPFCVVGNAGTVNTGAIDPLAEIGAICREYDLWFHIDGAFGAAARCLPEFEEMLSATAEADSLAFDFHKWFHIPYESGCALIRDAASHRSAFASSANYLLRQERGSSSGLDSIGNYGIELSRGFKALKVWMLIQEHGLDAYASLIRQNLRQASGLARMVRDQQELELLAPVPLNIVCFRFVHPLLPGEVLNRVNKEILMDLQEDGIAVPSSTWLNGKFAIRVAISNHRTRWSDLQLLVKEAVRLGRRHIAPYLELMGENLDC